MTDSLLLRACKAGLYGDLRIEDGGYIAIARNCYCYGKPSEKTIIYLRERCSSRPLVPMTVEWQNWLMADPGYITREHYRMRATEAAADTKKLMKLQEQLPEGFRLCSMSAVDIANNPFGLGRQYASAAAFERDGAGCTVRKGDEIVCAAASYVTIKGEIIPEIITQEGYTNLGLEAPCCAALMRLCLSRGLKVDWTAEDIQTCKLAMDLGYEIEDTYKAYIRRTEKAD